MIYLDFAATTKPSKDVLDIFVEVNMRFWANPDSLHGAGIKAEAVLEQARKNILEKFNAKSQYNLIFTSGATESNKIIIKNFVNSNKKHIISSNIEHPSVREPLFALQKEGFEVEFLPVNKDGTVCVEQIKNAVKNDTALVSIMHVNNEIGSVNNVFEIAKAVKEKNKNSLFHSDFSQSVGKLNTSLDGSQIDFISFSGHKIECVKGIGAIIYRRNISLPHIRLGTANPAVAAALAKALKIAVKKQKENYEKVLSLQNVILKDLRNISEIRINSPENNSPFILNFSVPKFKAETLIHALSEKEIYVSSVSACSSKKNNESFVVKAITNDSLRAKSSIRVSLSTSLTKDDLGIFVSELKAVVERIK